MGATLQSSELDTAPRFLRLVGDSAVFSLGRFLGKIAALLLLPVVTSRLAPESFGRLDVLSVATTAVSGTLIFGFDIASTRLFATLGEHDRRRMFATWGVVAAVVSCLFGGLTWIFASRISTTVLADPSFATEVRLLVPIVVGAIALNISLGVQRNENQPWSYAICSGGAVVSSAVLVAVFVIRESSVQSVLLAQGTANVLFGLSSLLLVRSSIAAKPSWHLLRRLRTIGLPLAPIGAVVAFGELLSRTLLLRLSDSAEVGLLSVSVRIGSVLLVMSIAIQTAWHPRAFSMRSLPDSQRRIGLDIVRLTSLASCAAVALAIITPATVDLVSAEDYAGAVLPSGLMIVAALGFSVAQLLTIGLLIDSRTSRVTVSVVAGVVVGVLGTVAASAPFGAVGAAAALAAGQWTYAGVAWLLGRNGFSPRYKLRSVVLPSILASIFVIVATVGDGHSLALVAVGLMLIGTLFDNGTAADTQRELKAAVLRLSPVDRHRR